MLTCSIFPIIEHCEDLSLAGGSMNEGFTSNIPGASAIPAIAEDLIVIAGYSCGRICKGKNSHRSYKHKECI